MPKKKDYVEEFSGYKVVNVDSVRNMEGRLLTILEALGLRDTQERSVKSIVSSTIWDWFHDKTWHADISQEEAVALFARNNGLSEY